MLTERRPPFRLYAVTDRSLLGGGSLAEALDRLGREGLRGVEIREKDLDPSALEQLLAECAPVLSRHGMTWLLNGPVEAAIRGGAAGVHLPSKEDAAAVRARLGPGPSAARAAAGSAPLVGQSAHGAEEAGRAARAGADFIVVGPVFETPSKAAFGAPLGLGVLARACAAAAPVPVFAIGGVDPARAAACRDAGAFGVASQGPLMRAAAGRDAEALRELLRAYAETLGGL